MSLDFFFFIFFFQFSVRNSSGTFPEIKLKNCFFMENLSLDLSGGKKKIVYGTLPNISGDKTEKLFMGNLSLDVSGRNNFSILLTEIYFYI